MTDGELVERVRAGNTAAFGELVERHQGAVYRAALAALRNIADADDVAQDALVLAFQKIDQFRGDAGVRTWMVTIAWRLACRDGGARDIASNTCGCPRTRVTWVS